MLCGTCPDAACHMRSQLVVWSLPGKPGGDEMVCGCGGLRSNGLTFTDRVFERKLDGGQLALRCYGTREDERFLASALALLPLTAGRLRCFILGQSRPNKDTVGGKWKARNWRDLTTARRVRLENKEWATDIEQAPQSTSKKRPQMQ